MPEIAVKVTKAEYVSDYVLKLTFSDGTVKNVDFLPLALIQIFQFLLLDFHTSGSTFSLVWRRCCTILTMYHIPPMQQLLVILCW